MKNVKKCFSFSRSLNIKNIKCIAKNRDSVGGNLNSLNVFLATENCVYSYCNFSSVLNILCNVSEYFHLPEEDVDISSLIYDDITESLLVCLKSGYILSFKVDGDSGGDNNILAIIPGGLDYAEWSPDREMCIVSNRSSVYLLSATYYDVISEINPSAAVLGQNVQMNVGWGKKETQFHGSEGKAAAKKNKIVIESSLINDDHKTHVSWRGDSQLFSISYWDESCNQRFIKMFDKSGSLLAINEEMTGITGPISWRPFGDLLAFSERAPDNYVIGFLEKNGLKHGEFNVPPNLKVKKVSWNSDSSILALVCIVESTEEECLLLWTTCNYHWYLKQKIVFSSPLVYLLWDDTRGNRLYGVCQDSTIFIGEWITTVDSNREWCVGTNYGYVSVIDGNEVLLTSFKEAIIPPPMSKWSLKCSEAVNSVLFPSWSSSDDGCEGDNILCTILHNNNFVLWRRDGSLFTISENIDLPLDSSYNIGLKASLNHWIWFGPYSFATIRTVNGSTSTLSVFIKEEVNYKEYSTELPFCSISLHYFEENFLVQSSSGVLYKVNSKSLELDEFLKLPEPCNRLEFNSKGIYCLSEKNRLYKDADQIGSQITSFLLHGSFLLATTSLHTLVIFKNSTDECTEISTRKLENGSRLIVATETTVIFQLPRGNLEAIQPCALTIESVGRLLENSKFKEAVSLLSRQRIDLNLAVDHNSNHFLKSVDDFVCQVDSKWLTLLITELKPESVTSSLYSDFYEKDHAVLSPEIKVGTVCHALYSSMKNDKDKYILPILGTLVKTGCMSEALELAISEDSLQHLLFLVDVDKLYNEALLAYNLGAALRIAGKSQKDPKEYLPYLNSLRAMETNYMKYSIDKSLNKPGSALKHISQCEGEDRFDECLQLVKDHSLYSSALKLFPRTSQKYKIIAELYGDHLSSLKRYDEAGLMFKRSGSVRKAIEPYMKIGEWRQCLALSNECDYSDKEKEVLIHTLKGVLKGMQKYQDAGTLCLDVLHDVPAGIEMFLLGKLWKDAIYVAKSKFHESLIDTDIKKALLEHSETLCGEIKTYNDNFTKHFSRLQIVRENKNKPATVTLAEPWDAQSETSSVSSLRTGHSSVSRSSKNTRKTIRKMWSLKEGNPREEQALISTLATLMESIEKMSSEVQSTGLSLLELYCDDVALEIQSKYKMLLELTVTSKHSIWPKDPDVDEITIMDERLKIPPQSNIMQSWELDILNS